MKKNIINALYNINHTSKNADKTQVFSKLYLSLEVPEDNYYYISFDQNYII